MKKSDTELTEQAILRRQSELEAEITERERQILERREALAAYSHEAWSNWMKYMFGRGQEMTLSIAGVDMQVWTMPPLSYERWQRQMNTPYAELTESEKTSDRAEADKIIAILSEHP